MRVVSFCLMTLIYINNGTAQLEIKLHISQTDSLGDSLNAYFGVDERATNCIDTSLGEFMIWWQLCGLNPCLAFIDVQSPLAGCLGSGTPIDLRPYYSTSQVDTYRLEFSGYFPIVFRWQSDIAEYYHAMTFMNSRDSTAATIRVNMLDQDSFVITSQMRNDGWYILAESPTPVTDIQDISLDYPSAPALLQNYPNPFNPSTTIEFTLAHEALVTLTVYDIVGREVKILTRNRQFGQGVHRLDFSVENLTSGMYFYKLTVQSGRMSVPENSYLKKMVILK